jgi:pantetheine-phosphate adenylyltransferase
MAERTAVYPGSFDPPTNGHLDLVERASRMFDHLIVAVARNNAKQCLFSVEERVGMLKAITGHVPRVEVASFEGLTAEYARQREAVALVRGLRVLSDFEFEMSIAITNSKLNPSIDTVCFMPSEQYIMLSSRVVREVARYGGDISEFVPPVVATRLREKMAGA